MKGHFERNPGVMSPAAFDHFLAEGRKPETREAFDRVWLMGALLMVGDALGANRYFGHEPEAEIIRHLRNSIAHGNRFKFDPPVIDKTTGRLKHPANISRYAARQAMPVREVDTNLRKCFLAGEVRMPSSIA
jgi:hypothetical protein